MPTTTFMGLLLPTVGQTTGTLWASEVNDALTSVDSHDHTSGRGVRVPTAGLNIDATVDFQSNQATNVSAVGLFPRLNPAPDLRTLSDAGTDGDLFWTDANGAQVQLTKNGTLNFQASGGIGGDYASSTATVNYDNSTKTFTFNQSSNFPAKLSTGDVQLRETSNGVTNNVALKSPSGLAASYSLLFPAQLPAQTSNLQVTSAGQMTSSYYAEGFFSASIFVGGVKFSGSFLKNQCSYRRQGAYVDAYGYVSTLGVLPSASNQQAWVASLPFTSSDQTGQSVLTIGNWGGVPFSQGELPASSTYFILLSGSYQSSWTQAGGLSTVIEFKASYRTP